MMKPSCPSNLVSNVTTLTFAKFLFKRRPAVSASSLFRRTSGMVLIVILVCLSLMALLVLAFIAGATSEMASSKSHHSSIQSQNLAGSALNLVLGQLAEATRGADADGNVVSWASQPGMIRTYTAASGGVPGRFYKLYSDSEMQLDGVDFNLGQTAPPQNWNQYPAIYTDLNAPVGTGDDVWFPIVDPRASAQVGGDRTVDGFSYDPAAVGGASDASPEDARLPMPVMWLYVLKDGSFAAPEADPGSNERAIVPGASQGNPIVGRVAFWTDDESSKVNINTASEGKVWDVPMATYQDEVDLNNSYPVQGEFQRYQGHPATTSLSTVFPWLKGGAPGSMNDPFYQLTPRIQQGGSLEGTVSIDAEPSPIQHDADRLYDNVDELIFDANRSKLNHVDPEDIERRRFFLTAQSRSPETTLFNTPRVAVWPLHANPDGRHAAEKLIAHAASAGSGGNQKEYFFTRANQFDPVTDFNDVGRSGRNPELLGYLQEMTSKPVPGYGSSFATKWGSPERDQILTEIYDYIRSCVNLRMTVLNGVIVPGNAAGGHAFTGNGRGRKGVVFPTALEAGTALGAGHTLSTDTRGFGRFPTIREVSLIIGCEEPGETDPPNDPGGTVTAPWKIWPALVMEVFTPAQGNKTLWPNIKVTAAGWETFQWEIKPTSAGSPVDQAMFPTGPTRVFNAYPASNIDFPGGANFFNAFFGVPLLHYNNIQAFSNASAPLSDDCWGPTVENWDAEGFVFKGGTLTLTVELADSNVAVPSSLRQSFTITFPPTQAGEIWPNPTRAAADTVETMSERLNYAPSGLTSIAMVKPGVSGAISSSRDVVKSMVVQHGDYRLTAAKTDVPSTDFTPHRLYHGDPANPASARNFLAHTLRFDAMTSFRYADLGAYVAGMAPLNPGVENFYSNWNAFYSWRPTIPGGSVAENALSRPGDWDNGVGIALDGPFINKADEGIDYDPGGVKYGNQTSYLSHGTKSTTTPTETQFGPMRQIASPVMFGSLSTGVKRDRPWQTLLFSPNPASGWGTSATGFKAPGKHEGFSNPPDHLLLDLFWMPVTEPYAISDRFSTAGKINLNYQMMPFTYIRRDTGMRAVLASQTLPAFDETMVPDPAQPALAYKRYQFESANKPVAPGTSRHPIDANETFKQFEERFAGGEIFKSATEICEMFLVPAGSSLDQTRNESGFWSDKRLTGDNMRERPYNAIYPRVTTRSNVFTVYVTAQSLKQVPSTLDDPAMADTFTEGKDVMEGSFQASYTFERYLDPNAAAPDSDTAPLGPYKLRVISQRNLAR